MCLKTDKGECVRLSATILTSVCSIGLLMSVGCSVDPSFASISPQTQHKLNQKHNQRIYPALWFRARHDRKVYAGRNVLRNGRPKDGHKSWSLLKQETSRLWDAYHADPLPPPSPRENAWQCIHRYEGAWNSNTGNGYYGGLQMDSNFMYTYGSDMIEKYGGYAHLWSMRDQIIVADRAYLSGRGFAPWPNTARMCGLI